jgi:8-oxo-dGTP diphosphatase
LEYGEDPLVCAEREAEEETGLKIKAHKIVGITNDVFEAERKHYVTLFAWCEQVDPTAEARVSPPSRPLPANRDP